jgi:hypothetical protein
MVVNPGDGGGGRDTVAERGGRARQRRVGGGGGDAVEVRVLGFGGVAVRGSGDTSAYRSFGGWGRRETGGGGATEAVGRGRDRSGRTQRRSWRRG